MKNKKINLFFACDDNYIPFLSVTLKSIFEKCSKKRDYQIFILNDGLKEENIFKIKNAYQSKKININFCDVSSEIEKINQQLHTRDYYSKAIYYRLFIPTLFPNLDKALYLDCDIIFKGDVTKLYDIKLGENLVGAVHDMFVESVSAVHPYVENRVGVQKENYFNSGVLLMNLTELRKFNLKDKFLKILNAVKFEIAPDQDYLNALCKDRVKQLDYVWNFMPLENTKKNRKINLIHFNLDYKPWKKEGILYGDLFWKIAEKTNFIEEIKRVKANFNQEKVLQARKQTINFIEKANIQALDYQDNQRIQRLISNIREDVQVIPSSEKLEVLEKIKQLEKLGIFDKDVENDPQTKPLLPSEIKYLKKGPVARIKRWFAFLTASSYFKKAVKNKQIIINDIVGIENLSNVEGAIITCNHFNPFDSFVMQHVFNLSKHKKRMYRVIKEGNYTSFGGFFGFLMRNCDTLPLSSNTATMKKFYSAVSKALKEKNCVLIYPEQSMWWNYRKPKPLKNGAFQMAVKNNVPVVPCFITLEDSDIIGDDGFPVQIYTPHIGQPIYVDEKLSRVESIEKMKRDNFNYCKSVYEDFYNIPLKYTTERI